MATAFDKTAIASLLLDRLDRGEIGDLCYQDKLLLKLAKREEKVGGDQYAKPVKIARGAGVSATFADARSNATTATYGKWRADYKKLYKSVFIDNQAIAAASTKSEEALVDLFVEAVEDGKASMLDEIENTGWRSGSGLRGVVGSVSGATVTLKNVEDVVNFEKDDVLVVAAAETSGGLETGSVTLARVDRAGGKLIATGNWSSGISSIAGDQFIFRKGDRNLKAEGLLAHLPVVRTASPYSFQNVDLSVDWTRLAGVYVASKNKQISTAILDGMAMANREGAKPKTIVLGPSKFGILCQELQNARIFDTSSDLAKLGFSGIEIPTSYGKVTVHTSQRCPDSYGFGLPNDIRVVAQGRLVDFPGVSGDGAILAADADQTEVRLVTYYNWFIADPNNGVVFDFTA